MNIHLYAYTYTEVCIYTYARCIVLRCVAIYSVVQCVGSVLQCVAVCCSVLQRVAACCRMLQRVAVCCNVMQRTCILEMMVRHELCMCVIHTYISTSAFMNMYEHTFSNNCT